MSDKKQDLLIFVVTLIFFDLIFFDLIFGVILDFKLIIICAANILVGIIFLNPPKYIKISVALIAVGLAFLDKCIL
ncbi:hypothetical protein [Lactococcus lactis]|uniref:hypothetical protein n=1 Tax=Lactococcus lactis TaxID=1358 RepID=UPI002072B1B2|nr:hypothetical protein [Lactococcus lactis]